MRLFGLFGRRSSAMVLLALAGLLSACANAGTTPQASTAVEHPSVAAGNPFGAAEKAIAVAGEAATATWGTTTAPDKTATPGKTTTAPARGRATAAAAPSTTAAAPSTTAAASGITADGVSGWVPLWTPSFNGPANSGVNARDWSYATGSSGFGDSEIETMTSSTQNVYLDGQGDVDITALGSGSTWTSGRLESNNTYVPPAGGEMLVTASLLAAQSDERPWLLARVLVEGGNNFSSRWRN